MSFTAQSPISLTILRRGDMLLVDVAELGSLIPRSETQVDDAFLQELAAEVSQLATPGYGRIRTPLETAPPGREPERVVQELRRIGGVIFSHLLTESVRTRLRTAEPCPLYLRLDEHLIQVPWELGFDGEHFLATKFRIGRQVITGYPLPAPRATRVKPDTLKVLIIADPTESLPQASREVEQLCTLLGDIAGVKVTLWGGKNIRKLPLLAALQEYDVVHFAGHSEYDPAAPHKSGWRLHEGILTAAELSKLTRPPLLVFSNSCQAGTTAAWAGGYRYEGQAFGIGSAFLLAGVQNYIGTFWVVHDEESVGFALSFYRSLAAGQTLGESLQQARHATLTQSQGQGLTWASYMLYGNPTTALLSGPNAQPLPELSSVEPQRAPPPEPKATIPVPGDASALTQPQTEDCNEQSMVAAGLARMPRKLAAIFSADVAGYSRLMGEDEEATIRTLAAYQGVMRRLIQQHRGRVVDAPGDNMLAEFASVVDAVRCAVEIQQALRTKNAELPSTRQMVFRIGVNLGDVVVEGEKLYGDGVNIAARLEALAEPGGICISGTVYDQIENKLALGYEYIGEQVVKNIATPVRVYRVQEAPSAAEAPVGAKERTKASRDRRWAAWAAAALLLIGIGLVAIQNFPSSFSRTGMVQPAGQPLPLPDKPSIAVLPFVNMSEDPKQEYFSDGITEDLITDLSKISGLFVIARNSVFTYKGKATKIGEVGKELGVRYIVEGSVRKANERVRVTAQLVDVTTDTHLWAERYDRPLQEIFALQDELTQKIVLALKVKLMPQEQERFRRAPTNNLEAYDAWLRGEAQLWTFTKEANTQARQLFEQAITLDPQYAAAHATLSVAQLVDWLLWAPFQSSLDQIFASAQKAVEIDEGLPLAHSVLGYVYTWKKQHDQALVEAQRAITLNPNFADGYYTLAIVLNFMGRWEESIVAVEKGLKLNPTPPAQYLLTLSDAYVLAGRYKEALTTARKALAYNPNLVEAFVLQAISYSELGQKEAAQTTVATLLRLVPDFSLEVAKLKSPYKDYAIMERRISLLHEAGVKWYWPTDNAEALGSVWSGLEQLERSIPTKESIGKARQLFERALERDPLYAGAYAFLSRTYLMEWVAGWSNDPQTLERAVELGQKAVTLDSSLPWIRRELGSIYLWKKQHEQAIREGERAIALDPMDAEGYVMLAEVLNFAGQPEKAASLAEQALTLAPQNPIFALGEQAFAYQLLGQYEDALPLHKKVTAAIPNNFGAHLGLAIVYSELGQKKEAQAEVKEMLRLLPHFTLALMKERQPFKNPVHLQRGLNALRKAGLK